VKFYKSWLGFYPFKFLYIIPGASQPMGGYPFASGIVVIHGQQRLKTKPLLHWKWITAHEIGHQYWGEYVMGNDVPAWLWIGMGIYADREYTIFRGLGMDKHTGLMNRYLNGVRKHLNTTVDIPQAQYRKIGYDFNNVVIHGKGYSIISALEFVLGKETFEKIYKKCLKDYGRKCLGYKEFWMVCEEESSENLQWFFDQWVRSNKYLSYQIVSKESLEKKGKYLSKIKVESLGSLQMPVPVKAVFEDGSSQIKITNRLFRINYLEFESKSKLKEAILNPDNKLALLETPLEATLEELSEIISLLPWTGAGEDALRAYKKAKSLKLDNVRFWFKLGLTLFDGGYYKESFDAFEKLTELDPPKFNHFAALVWMGHLQDLFNNREQALKYYNEALKYDVGRTMRHDQWGMKIDRQWIEERLKSPFKWGRK
jgi:tetratricopeptide (TPR) repeat protein